ncbi:MAG: hypothetical protein K0R89_2743, partial [Ramlibacter sp.]|nr:hypothetical protein [Ramlibacter sp.]
ELIDVTGAGNGGRPGQAAVVVALDGVSRAPSTVVTAADGVYAFPLVRPSTYRLRVTPPAGFVFPSTLPAALQPTGRIIDTPGSYGGNFRVALGAVRFDVPLDTGGSGGLTVQKVANRSTAEVGDFVDYTVTVRNVMAVPLHQVMVRDGLPSGFTYVAGTARLGGQAAPDPVGDAGPQLAFDVGRVAAGAQVVLTYRLRVGPGSQGGTGINTAQAAGQGVTSNRATARVLVLGGVFSTDGYLIGKVYADCSRNGLQDAGEPGIPGVRIYLEDGTYAITDEEGKYSLYGLSARTHVAKVDPLTLPAGATLRVLDNRNARDGGSRFVDLKNGELHKADFAIGPCDTALGEQVAARRKALQNPSEIIQAAGVLLSATATTGATDTRTLPATGGLGLPGAARGNAGSGTVEAALPGMPALGAVGDTGGSTAARLQGLPQPIYRPATRLLQPAIQAAAAVPQDPDNSRPLEDLLPAMNAETGFVSLRDGQVLPKAQTSVRVKGPLGATFDLTVNGQPVPATQVGKRSSLEQVRVTAWEYIGVDLRPGRNVLEVKVADGFGNVRGRAQITVVAPGELASVRIDVPQQPVADPTTPVPVAISLHDAEGVPVTARAQLTLSASAGLWQVADADARQPGIQVQLEGGAGRFMLLPPAQPGKADLVVLAGAAKGAASVEFVPNLRPLVAAGIVEGTINLRNLNPSAMQPVQSGDVFEREIGAVSRSFNDGKGAAGARAALFLKGKVLGSSLLTVAYDSDKASDTRLFRDIQPNLFYPVYGDSSARGFDGQSSGKLYVLLQNGSNYVLVGDFQTQSDNPARQLTQYARALNGAKGRWSEGKVQGEAFASRTSATQLVMEFRANGTSGPFLLNADGVINSEQVHVIVRDRNQPSVVRTDTPLAAFTDYTIEPYSGMLLLKAPQPSVDADLNPVFIRVSYDVDAGGPKHTVAGAEASVEVLSGTRVGAVVVRDEDPANTLTLQGLTLTSRIGESTAITAELARTRTDLQGDGQGVRVDARHEGPTLQAHVWGVRTDAGFQNPGSPQTAGQSEYGAKAGYVIDPKNRIVAEALRTSNATTGAEQTGAELKLEHALPGNAKLEIGVRHSSANVQAALSSPAAPGTAGPVVVPTADPAAPTEQVGYTSARAKLTVPVPGVPEADVYTLVEHAIDGSGGREVAVGGNYAVGAGTRLYVRHSFINSLNGPYTLSTDVSRHTSVAGVDTTVLGDTQLFSEYRMGDAIDGRTAEAAVGLRRTFRLPVGLNVTASGGQQARSRHHGAEPLPVQRPVRQWHRHRFPHGADSAVRRGLPPDGKRRRQRARPRGIQEREGHDGGAGHRPERLDPVHAPERAAAAALAGERALCGTPRTRPLQWPGQPLLHAIAGRPRDLGHDGAVGRRPAGLRHVGGRGAASGLRPGNRLPRLGESLGVRRLQLHRILGQGPRRRRDHHEGRVRAPAVQVRRVPPGRRRRRQAMSTLAVLARRLLLACAAFALAALLLPGAALAATCGAAAVQGTAPNDFRDYCWLDFSTYNNATASSSAGQPFTFNLPDGTTVTMTVKTTGSGGLTSVAVPSWTGSAFGNSAFNNIPGRPILYTATNGTSPTVTLSNINVIPPAGAGTSTYSIVVGDGESTNGGETLTFTTDGSAWQQIAQIRNGTSNTYPTLTWSNMNKTVRENGADGTVGSYVFRSDGNPKTVTAALVGSGLQGIIIGMRYASISVVSQIVNKRYNSADQFTFGLSTTSGTSLISASTSGTAISGFTPAIMPTVAASYPFAVSQVMAAGSVGTLANYQTSLSCTNANPSATFMPNNAAASSYTFPNLRYGDSVLCTFTNTPIFNTLGGTVYRDANHNGSQDGTEAGPGATGFFVKIAPSSGGTCAAPATQAATVAAATGAYTLPELQQGTYCLILDDNNTLTDVTPTLPAGWLGTQNPGG